MQIWLHKFLTEPANLMSAKRESHLVPVFIITQILYHCVALWSTLPPYLGVASPIRRDRRRVLIQVTPISINFQQGGQCSAFWSQKKHLSPGKWTTLKGGYGFCRFRCFVGVVINLCAIWPLNEHNTDFDFCKVISPGIESHMPRTGFLQAMELMSRQLECFVQILNLCGTSYFTP